MVYSLSLSAPLPLVGSVVPQNNGPWAMVLNSAGATDYSSTNFPDYQQTPGVNDFFNITAPGNYAVIGVICEKNSSNQFVIISGTGSGPARSVSNKIFINLPDFTEPNFISGAQHLCEGFSNVYSIPTYLAAYNPQWTVIGGSFTGSGTSIQINWTVPFMFVREVIVNFHIGEEHCSQVARLEVFDCCTLDNINVYNSFEEKLSESLFAGLGVASPSNTGISYVVINGYFHVDENFEFAKMAIYMAPYSRITVADNVHFTIDSSNIEAICGVMYDGIFTTNETQEISFLNSTLTGAIHGLNSDRGGKLNVINSSFRSCRNAIVVKNYNPELVEGFDGNTSPIKIYGSEFLGVNINNGINNYLLPPYVNVNDGHVAISIENTGFVEIGVRNQLANVFIPLYTQQYIHLMEKAISFRNSGGNVVNNKFYNNGYFGPYATDQSAIVAVTSDHRSWIQPLQIGKLWIGGLATDANHFENGHQAIHTTNVRSVFIQDNTFNHFERNITVINALSQRVIRNNKINLQLGSAATPNLSARGIIVSSTHLVPTSGGVVTGNHIEACEQGILLNSVNSVTVNNNVIRTFTAQGVSQSSTRSGISAVNGWNINIYRNNMQHNNLPLNSDLTGNNLRGINLNNVVDAFVWDNYVLRYGAGVFAENDNRVSQFRCNFLVNSIWGFNFANVYLDQQGNPGDPTDNQWVGNRRAIRTNGTEDAIPLTLWYYRSGVEFNPNALAPSLLTISPILTSGGEVECSNVVLPNDTNPKDDKYEDPEIVEEVFGAVVDSSIQFSSASVQYFEESMTYRILDQNPTIIQQTTTRQQAFDDFYTAHHTSSKGDVKRLYDALLGESTNDYEQMLSTFQPSNTFENKIAEVSTIYAQSWAKGRFELDSAERSVLLPIAQADASAWGEAVYTARVMLGMFDLDGNIGAGNQRRALNEVVIADAAVGTAYPNPTTGSFSFAGSIETGLEKAEVKMYDLQGRLMATPKTYYADGVWQVVNPDLNAGMYLYRFYIDGAEVQHGKIVIQ